LPVSEDRPSLAALAAISLRIGLVAYGGPATAILLLEHELVDRRKVTTKEGLLQSLTISRALPGSTSPQLLFSTGYHLRGVLGGTIMAATYLIPSFMVAVLLTIGILRFGANPWVAKALRGVAVGAVGLIFAAVVRLGGTILKDPFAWFLAAVGCALSLAFRLEASFLVIGGGLIGWAVRRKSP
jgi:chromate transporter